MIEPLDGVSGQLDYLDSDCMPPWFEYRDRVSFAAFRGSVSAIGVQFLFSNCSLMKSVDLSGLDTSSATSTYFMFADCSSLVSVDPSNLDTSSVKYMSNMFYGRSSLASVDLPGLDTSSVRGMRWMFRTCSSLTSLDLSSLDVSLTRSMSFMFEGCSSLSSLDLSSFDTSSAENMRCMFDGCSSLARVALGAGFSFEGSGGSRQCSLPDGYWRASSGDAVYAAVDVPSDRADVYSRPTFHDATASTPHLDGVSWLATSGISTGYPDDTFRPFADVARCDMAAFLYRLAGSPAFEPTSEQSAAFSDVGASTPHYREVLWLASTVVSKGWSMPDGTAQFRPFEVVKRADMAAFLHRMSDKGLVG